ncbi:Nfx1-type zinc finger-containing protein [Aureococcus anophagefferens]|nr:Nfx1-type zinc finger-containing protein [Aureococcus anophagefferens]
MACCGTSATTGAVASTRSPQGPPPKLISSKSSKSLYGSQPFGDARSCEIFVEHAVAGFWHCASCGVPKCSHFNAKRCAAVPPPKDHAGPVYQRKGSKRGGSWRDREATLVAGKLKLFEVAEGGGPGPHVATYVVDANAHVVVGDQSEGRRHALRIETASGARVRLACAAPEARDATARPSRRPRGARAGAIRDDGGAAGAPKRAGERLAARLETSTDRDLVKAFGKGVAGKACRSLMKLNEAAHRAASPPPSGPAASALRAPVGEGLKIAGVDARDRAAACTRVLCSLAREPTLQQALSAYSATRSGRGGAALTGADEIVAPTLLLADAALLSYGPANLDSLAPTNENAAAYATTVLLNLASAAAASTEGHEAVTAALRDLGAAKHWPGTDSRGLQCEPWGCVEARLRDAATHLVADGPGHAGRDSTPTPPTTRRRRPSGAAAAESDAPVAVVLRVDAPPPAEDGEDKAVAKYRKLLKMGMPRDGIATKMAAEGLDPALLGLEPPAALTRERSTRAYPKPVAAPRATEKLKALWLPDLARDFRQEAGAARNGPPAALREEASQKNFAAPLDAKRAQQAALSLRKIQDAGLGDAARVAAALRGERGADLGLDEDALELVRRVGLPPKAADDAGERAALAAAGGRAAARRGPVVAPLARATKDEPGALGDALAGSADVRRAEAEANEGPTTPPLRDFARWLETQRAFDRCLADLAAGDARGRRADDRAKREAARRRARANHGLAPDGKGEVRDLFDDGANLLGMLERRRVAIEGGDDDDFASDEGDDDWDD